MSKWKLLVVCTALLFVAGTAMAQEGSLRDQSAANLDGNDNPMGIDPVLAAAIGTDSHGDCETFVVQTGTASWSAIYQHTPTGESGWLTFTDTGDDTWKIEVYCDIEMYILNTIANHKIYFHRGDALTGEQVAYIQGTFSANNGMYIGIENPRPDTCDVTLLSGTTDVMGRDISPDAVDTTKRAPQILVSWTLADEGSGYTPPTSGTGTHRGPDSIGLGDNNSVTAMWWLINGGLLGLQQYEWKVSINPPAGQPDGHYELDPVVTAKPVL